MQKNTNNHLHILIVDDEPLIRQSLFESLRIEGFQATMSSNGEDALEKLRNNKVDILLTDLKLPKMSGIQLLEKVKKDYPQIEVILITGFGTIETAVEAMRKGAYDYITKPINDQEVRLILQKIVEKKQILQENQDLKKIIDRTTPNSFCSLVGRSEKMQKVYQIIESVASTNATILINGESGTGKGMTANAIHQSDRLRGDKPFVEVSCGALSETLLESELFGHVKGAFTGAIKDKEGRFEFAKGGTIFLDEIDAFSPNLQVKLLRVLQDGVFERVGDNKTRHADVRIIVATNQNLNELVAKGKFREDLYYRINVIAIPLPPLRERRDDIEFLAKFFIEKYSKINRKSVSGLSLEALDLFKGYHWPGNVRELENAIEGAVIMAKKEIIQKEDIPSVNRMLEGYGARSAMVGSSSDLDQSLKKNLETPEKELILAVLEECRWNRNKAAERLGINRTTLYNKMKKYNISFDK